VAVLAVGAPVAVDAVVLALELEFELEPPHPAAAIATATSAIGARDLTVVFVFFMAR
jgi:hypothetical protein